MAFHRDALASKCQGLTDNQLVERAVEPSPLSLLGLVRHMAEMERAYGVWALGPKADLVSVWGTYQGGAEHDFDCDATMVGESMRVWKGEMRKTDEALGQHSTLDELGAGNRSACVGTSPSSSASTPDTMATPISSVNGSTARPE